MTDLALPPCDADVTDLPAPGTRVRHLTPTTGRRYGTVHGTDPVRSTLLVLRDGAFFSEVYPAADWEDDDDGFDEHDADDALHDGRREDDLR